MLKQSTPWTDTSFNYNQMIYWSDYLSTSSNLHYFQPYLDRARNRIPNATLFGNTSIPSPTDASQGMVGDCYYLSIVSAESELPQRIKSLFVTDYTPQGMIVIKAVVLGEPVYIVIDDYLPFYSSSGNELAFAKTSPTGGLYSAFLEKAWAKLSGNYEFIGSGWEGEAIRFLSGAPTDN